MSKVGKLILTPFRISSMRQLSLSSANFLDQDWRAKKGLSPNPNKTSPLLDRPDYIFLSGKPTPFGTRQTMRILKQREYTEKIIQLTEEMDHAVARFNEIQKKKKKDINEILNSKLTEKGTKTLS